MTLIEAAGLNIYIASVRRANERALGAYEPTSHQFNGGHPVV